MLHSRQLLHSLLLAPASTQLRPAWPSKHCVRPARRVMRARAALGEATAGISHILRQFRGGAASLGAFLEAAPPPLYLVYMLAAGVGFPCSEDALVVWVGAGICNGKYGGTAGVARVLAIVWFGIVVSDLLTWSLGALARRGFLRSLKDRLFRDPAAVERAERIVQRHSKRIGFVQRFTIGFRGPLCLVSGFSGVTLSDFAIGASVGACITMSIQLTLGYMLRNTPNVYLTALAMAALPNTIGYVVGPVLTAIGLYFASRKQQHAAGNNPTPAAVKDAE